MWRPRDHERFIGGYDPEHGNDGGRWASDYDRAREFGSRGYERDWRDRQRFGRFDYDDDDRWRNRR